jgi:GNAT superfamily N-acetyltransferase
VLPEYRHQGFGRLLVDHVVRKAKDLGLSRVEIAIIAAHDELRKWYESQGFVLTSTQAFPQLPFEVAFMALSIG